MDWQILFNQLIRGVGFAVGILVSGGALFGAIEKIAGPVKKYRQHKEQDRKQQQELIALLRGWEGHVQEAHIRDQRLDVLEERQQEHRDDINLSREERKIMWHALRTLIITFREIVPPEHEEARRELTQSIKDMDKFANERMRGDW